MEEKKRKRKTEIKTEGEAGENLQTVIFTEICSVVFLQWGVECCCARIVTLELLCMNNISCAIICVFPVARKKKYKTDTGAQTRTDEE